MSQKQEACARCECGATRYLNIKTSERVKTTWLCETCFQWLRIVMSHTLMQKEDEIAGDSRRPV